MHLKFQHIRLFCEIPRNQHHIISAISTFPVRFQHILFPKFCQQSKYKSMIKSFRLRLSRWMPSGIKAAECNLCHIIHIYIHLFQISLQQCLNKRIIITIWSRKPAFKHSGKHSKRFQICDFQMIPRFQQNATLFHFQHFQISTGKQQTPNCIFILL